MSENARTDLSPADAPAVDEPRAASPIAEPPIVEPLRKPPRLGAEERSESIVFENVSRFYGEVLGVNRVNLVLPPGITGLVGPNGSGKSTLMNLMTGLLRPTRGRVELLGITPDHPHLLFHKVGYCSQFDAFPKGMTGRQFLTSFLRIHGHGNAEAQRRAERALARVGLTEAGNRKVAGYSKGMRQRIKLANAIAHDPEILILDEPLNGLDPMARAEVIALFQELRDAGSFLIISSHILHELDMVSDQVVLLDHGYVVAEGEVEGVRDEMDDRPLQVLIRCDRPEVVAAAVFGDGQAVGVQLHQDRGGLVVSTRNADRLHLLLNRIVVEHQLQVEAVAPADADVHALYEYLIGDRGGKG